MSKKFLVYGASVVSLLIIGGATAYIGSNNSRESHAADLGVTATADFSSTVRKIDPFDIGVGSSTYGANPLSSPAQSAAEQKLDARYIRIPVGWRNNRVTSSAGGGPTTLDVPALVRLYQSWGYRILAVLGGRTNDYDIEPGDATRIIQALGTANTIDYSAPNEIGNQGKSIQDEIAKAKMIVQEGKAINPNFRIWGPVWAYYDRATMRTFAAGLGQDLAGIDYHHYAMGSNSISTAQALSETPSYAREISEIRSDLQSLGLGDRPINVDELNFSWRYQDGTAGGNNRFFTTVNTVWMTSALGHILQSGGRGLPYASQNGPLGVMVEAGAVNPDNRPASSPMPAYWAIAAWTGGKIWPHYKDTIYNVSENDATGEIFAVNNEAGGYNIVLINKSETDSKTVLLNLKGISGGSYSLYQTNQAAPYDQPVKLPDGAYTNTAAKQIALPKMSVTVMVVRPGGVVTPPPPAPTPTPTPTPAPTPTPNPAAGAVTISTPLVLDKASVAVGQTIGGTVTYKNTGSTAVTINTVVIAGRGPGGSNASGPYFDFTSTTPGPYTIPAGATLTVRASRTILATDPVGSWYAYATYQDSAGIYHDGSNIAFTVTTTAIPPVANNGDINGDGRVNALDMSQLIGTDGQNSVAADLNKDGTVGAADMAILLSKWTW